MPVIVYKTMTIEPFYAQVRRIRCDECHQPFCYIVGGVESAETTGVPLVSSDDGMRESAFKKAIRGLRKTAKKKNVGEAMCPHCQTYQGWMVVNSHLQKMGCLSLLGLVLLGVAAAILNSIFEWTDNWLMLIGISLLAGAVLGLILGKVTAITRGPHFGEEDARAMTDDGFKEFLVECDERELDPPLAWWVSIGNEPGEKQGPVGLGIEDETGQFIYPVEMTTDHILDQAD